MKFLRNRILAALTICFSLSNCGKGKAPSPSVQQGDGDLMYPATVSFYQGNQNAYPTVYTYKYDDAHRLIHIGPAHGLPLWEIGSNGIKSVMLTATGDTLSNDYAYNGDIYTGNGVGWIKTHYTYKYVKLNSTYSGPESTYYFSFFEDGDKYVMRQYNAGEYSANHTYDDNGNLATVNWVTNAVGSPNSTEYDPGGYNYSRLTVTACDDKHSPFSAVAIYRFVEFPWSYPGEYALSFCKNNPTQIIVEGADDQGGWNVYSQTDFTYEYNEEGYATTIVESTVYPGSATPTQTFTKTSNFTYIK